MPTRLQFFGARTVAFRTRPLIPQKRFAPLAQRFASDDGRSPVEPEQSGPNQAQLPHVSEEQAAMDKTMGDTPPDIEGQGTPVKEVMERDPEAEDKMPEVMKKGTSNPSSSQSRSYSTSARRMATETDLVSQPTTQVPISMRYPDGGFGHKFALPEVGRIPRTDHLKRRYDAVVDQVTKSIMRHGKLSQAQKNMTIILDTLRTAPPPQPNAQFPTRSLLLKQPRASLPLSPVQYLTTAIDSVAPLLKIRQQRGVAGGGASLPIPVPLGVRQRRRQAIQWILASAAGRREVNLADRVAKEIINVAEGRSSTWDRRAQMHKVAISARSNIRQMMMARRSKKF